MAHLYAPDHLPACGDPHFDHNDATTELRLVDCPICVCVVRIVDTLSPREHDHDFLVARMADVARNVSLDVLEAVTEAMERCAPDLDPDRRSDLVTRSLLDERYGSVSRG